MSTWIRSKVEITEQPRRWQLRWSDGKRSYAKTAAGALRAVRRRDTASAKLGACCITTIVWTTNTRVGTVVVNALQGGR